MGDELYEDGGVVALAVVLAAFGAVLAVAMAVQGRYALAAGCGAIALAGWAFLAGVARFVRRRGGATPAV
ncbi:hypothetical protein, partial [Luedemannella flava]|uniref:hypothetical protein n=1 Tax=Luedemannella flava TaxID=349316 RepID=UPI0031E15474